MKIPLLLLSAFMVMVIVVGLIYLRRPPAANISDLTLPNTKSVTSESSSPQKVLAISSNADKPQSFGYKCFWLVIRSEDTKAIMEVLNLKNRQAANWASGLEQAYGLKKVFVTPPVQGWTFVVGLALPDAGDSEHSDQCTPLLHKLSEQFGEAQYFGTHRVVEYHAWAKAKNGEIVRAYAYVGEQGTTLWNIGTQTSEEKAFGFAFDDTHFPDEDDVMKIAGAWSINPQKLKSMNLPASVGFVGDL